MWNDMMGFNDIVVCVRVMITTSLLFTIAYN